MKQVTKISIALALIISLASCQSTKTGCYDFGNLEMKVSKTKTPQNQSPITISHVVCKP